MTTEYQQKLREALAMVNGAAKIFTENEAMADIARISAWALALPVPPVAEPEKEWGVRWPDGEESNYGSDEASARLAARFTGNLLISREAVKAPAPGPWVPATEEKKA